MLHSAINVLAWANFTLGADLTPVDSDELTPRKLALDREFHDCAQFLAMAVCSEGRAACCSVIGLPCLNYHSLPRSWRDTAASSISVERHMRKWDVFKILNCKLVLTVRISVSLCCLACWARLHNGLAVRAGHSSYAQN